jgi:hypothetical protein
MTKNPPLVSVYPPEIERAWDICPWNCRVSFSYFPPCDECMKASEIKWRTTRGDSADGLHGLPQGTPARRDP